MSSPKKSTRPAVGGKSPVMALKSVVLPAPFAPITARRSPAATANDTSSIALSAPNMRVTRSTTSASLEASGGCGEALKLVTVAIAPISYRSATDICGVQQTERLRAIRHIARAQTDLLELGLAHAQILIDVRD